jgi:hypothetical protein
MLFIDVAFNAKPQFAHRRAREGRGALPLEPWLLRLAEAETADLVAREHAPSGLRASVFQRERPPALPGAAAPTVGSRD